MGNRSDLLSNLDKSIYKMALSSQPEFKNVYSKQYASDVIFPLLDTEEKNYSFIFGDYNKLGIINNTYGHEIGTKALAFSLDLIKKVLPSNSMIIRLGGDEFGFIIPNCEECEAQKYIDAIHTLLEQNSTLICGLSIELAACDSKNGDISKLYSIAEGKVNEIKASRKNNDSPVDIILNDFIPLKIPENISKDEIKKWSNINEHINVITYNFLQNLRPSKKLEFKKEQIQDASSFIFSTISYLINKKSGQTQLENDDFLKLDIENYSIPDAESQSLIESNFLDSNTARLIHTLITDKDSVNIDILSDEALSSLINKMNYLINHDLIRDKNGLYTKAYFKNILANKIVEMNHKVSATIVSAPGIKLSNTAYDHEFTDYKMDKTVPLFLNGIYKNFNVENKSFEYNPSGLYVINYGPLEYLLIYPEEFSENVENKIGNIVNAVNANSDLSDSSSTFLLSYAPQRDLGNNILKSTLINTDSKSVLMESIKKLNDDVDYNKDDFKKMLFNSVDSLIAFKKLSEPLIDFYLNEIDSPNDINKKSILLSNFYRALLNYEVYHNETRITKKGHSKLEDSEQIL